MRGQLPKLLSLEQKEKDDLVLKYEEKFMNPYFAAARGYVDEVILPEETRERIISALDALKNKEVHTPQKKHGNIPL